MINICTKYGIDILIIPGSYGGHRRNTMYNGQHKGYGISSLQRSQKNFSSTISPLFHKITFDLVMYSVNLDLFELILVQKGQYFIGGGGSFLTN